MNTNNVNDLFQSARDEGAISAQSLQTLAVADIGAQIQNALGTSVDDIMASEVVLVTILMDDSGSMQDHEQAAREGFNLTLDAIEASKQQNNILAHTRFLHGRVLNPYTLIENAKRLDGRNYKPVHDTPLYEQSIVILGTVLAKTQEFYDNGVAVRTVTLIVTDGANNGSGTAQDVLPIVKDMLKTENHIICAMGIKDGITDFKQVFRDMGIGEKWILTPDDTQSAIRQAFMLASQTAARVTQNAVQFKTGSAGGFGAP